MSTSNPRRKMPTPSSTLPPEAVKLPDLTKQLQRTQIIGKGSFGIVWHCNDTQNGEVAVKAFTFPRTLPQADKAEFLRKMRRELGIWRRLEEHRNIVPLLGKARGQDFGSEHSCMVSMWMPHGTLADYVTLRKTVLPLPNRIQLIRGISSGLAYLHSRSIVHGDFHPGNILIDGDHNPRITDFGYSQTLSPQNQLTYLWTKSTRGGARQWVAPELLHPQLFPGFKFEATLHADIYALGSIIFFILSGSFPWKDSREFEEQIQKLDNPPPPLWPVIHVDVWRFIERCWSPKAPKDRPSAQDVLSFSRDQLGRLSQQSSASDINVVLFGTVGCGRSSIINILAEKQIARVSMNMEPCTRRPRCYQIPDGERQFRLWDTTGFCLPSGVPIDPLSPYQQAYTVLRDLPNGVHLILLCASMDEIRSNNPWLRRLYWLINNFFFGGHAPVAFVLTHFDSSENDLEKWWKSNQDIVLNNTEIPISSIPRACSTTSQRSGSRKRLLSFLKEHTTSVFPIPLRLDLSSHEAASRAIASNCCLSQPHAVALIDRFSRPPNQFSVVLFGKAGAGKSSVINLLVGKRVAPVSSDARPCTLAFKSHTINTHKKQFVIWDTMGFNSAHNDKAVMDIVQLIRTLSARSGIDLLVFVKDSGDKLTASEAHCYRLVEEFLCGGQVPVAVVVTHLENDRVMEEWWQTSGHSLRKSSRGNLIGHACITSAARCGPEDTAKLSESRQKVQALFEDCLSGLNGEEVSNQLLGQHGEEMDRAPEKMTVKNLVKHCGLKEELAYKVVGSYNDSR